MRRSVCLVAGLLLVQGCAFLGSDALDARMDVDFDGHIAEQFGGDDCDDQNPAIYAGALEIWYDGIDGNCDDWSDFDQDGDGLDSVEHGGVDCDDFDSQVGDHRVWYADEDQDGFGSLVESVQACEAPRNHLAWAEDCDDTNADNHPGADEWCDGVDNDCDGETDEDDAVDALIWYRDADEDGYGDQM